jgi:hypothetical protein
MDGKDQRIEEEGEYRMNEEVGKERRNRSEEKRV